MTVIIITRRSNEAFFRPNVGVGRFLLHIIWTILQTHIIREKSRNHMPLIHIHHRDPQRRDMAKKSDIDLGRRQ